MGDLENVRFVVNLVVVLLITPLGMILWSMLRRAVEIGERNKEDLAAHRLHASQTYATKTDLNATMGRVEKALEHVADQLDKLDDKIDRRTERAPV